MLLLLLLGCPVPSDPTPAPADSAGDSVELPGFTEPYPVAVTVSLDGQPVEGARVMQAGSEVEVLTDAAGHAEVVIDPSVRGEKVVVAARPGAWNRGVPVDGDTALSIALASYNLTDNPEYVFNDPGDVASADTVTRQCGHCHLTLHRDWRASPHADTAKNPAVHAVYQGLDLAVDEAGCAASGGTWGPMITPGTGAATEGCHVAPGIAEATGGTGSCADCHAPGIGGAQLAGHDLLEATGLAYDYGVHCDVCHRIQAVTEGGAPGVGGWLTLLRPLDPSPSPLLGIWHPLTFGPFVDVVNPLMGAAVEDDFHEAKLCGGCHQLDQPVLVSDTPIDLERWPDGVLPVMSTFEEWTEGPMNPAAPCQSCHMPPAPTVGNAADLGDEFANLTAGVAAGWWRAPGAVRHHSWVGPRTPSSGMLQLAAFVDLDTEVVDGVLTAAVTVRNVGPGHAIPTGEPLRNLVLRVDASCAGEPLVATGGDVVPAFGGALAEVRAPDALDRFPNASAGDTVRFLRTDGWIDYEGPGAFGDGRFTPAEKGLPALRFVATAEVIAVAEDGTVSLDPAGVPAGADTAFLIPGGDAEAAAAGLPGFGFARVLVGADGTEMVPHGLAVDVRSDNRLPPTEAFTTTHTFASPCEAPEVHAELDYRRYPWAEAGRYGWTVEDVVMAEADR